MESLLIGLLGALIGAGASLATVWIQSNSQAKRDRMRLVIELALEDYKSRLDFGKSSGRPYALPSITLFLHYHLELAKLLEKGSVTSSDLQRLTRENREIDAELDRLKDE